ncbi:MAG: protease modulator HflC [Parvularculaceae bacterium]
MLQNRFFVVSIVALIAVFIVVQMCIFVVRETENAIVIVLGNPRGVVTNAGIHPKLPWAEVVKIDKRNLEYDLAQSMEVSDVNQERLTVDAFARYRIIEPLVFYQLFKSGGDSQSLRRNGQDAIQRIMQNSLRQTLGEVSIEDIITNKRAELMSRIGERMQSEARKFGVEIIDVRIRRADYPADIAERVYAQMSSARTEEAELIRSEGRRENTRIQAEAQRMREQILADARRRALEIQGQADATRNCIFAGAYDGVPIRVEETEAAPEETGTASAQTGVSRAPVTCAFASATAQRDPKRAEFFAFYRSLIAYETALRKGESTIILSPDSEFFRYFNNLEGRLP